MIPGKAIALTKLYEQSMSVCGDVIELGVGNGESFNWWIQCYDALDLRNSARHFYGFDTFKGFPTIDAADNAGPEEHFPGDEKHPFDVENLKKLCQRFIKLHNIRDTQRVDLIQGDICNTLPAFIHKTHPWVIPALVYIDVDIYKPTLTAMLELIPRMPKYGVLAFDEVGFSRWPGETTAMYKAFEILGIPFNAVALQRCPYYLASAVIINDDRGTRIWE